MSGRHTANVIWALAKLAEPDGRLLGALCTHLPPKLSSCSAQNLANCFWAFGDLGGSAPPPAAAGRGGAAGAVWRAGCAWAPAACLSRGRPGRSLEHVCAGRRAALCPPTRPPATRRPPPRTRAAGWSPEPAVLQAMAQETLRQLPTYIPQNLSNTVLGCSKLGFKHEDMLEAVALRAQATLGDAAVQVRAGPGPGQRRCPCPMQAVGLPGASAGLRGCSQRTPPPAPLPPSAPWQAMSNLVYGYGRLAMPQPQLFRAIEAASLQRMSELLAQNIANIFHGFGTLGHAPGPAWMDAATEHLLRISPSLTPQNLANVAWGCAKTGYMPPQLVELVMETSIARWARGAGAGRGRGGGGVASCLM
jgi:hypothetical protein